MPLTPKPITIAGGGLAGLTLGLLLRRVDIPTTIYEAGNYPRHKVCGEFISGRGLSVLKRLRVLNEKHPSSQVERANFYSGDQKIVTWKLPEPAMGISRFSLDSILANAFQSEGGTLITDYRFTGDVSEEIEGVVLATGRKIKVDKKNWRYIGMKAHARLPNSIDHLQVHFGDGGYVGVSPLPNGLINVCGLFRFKGQVQNLKSEWQQLLRGAEGTALRVLLDKAEFQPESFSTVAGLNFQKEPKSVKNITLGDHFGMIAPLTGNGMSIAFETAEISSKFLIDYAFGNTTWKRTVIEVQVMCEKLLRRRMVTAQVLQNLLLGRTGTSLIFRSFGSFPRLINAAYRWTHS